MPLQVDDRFDASHKTLATYLRLASTSLGVVVSQPLKYNDVKRLIRVEDEELVVDEESEDALGEHLVEAAHDMGFEEQVGSRMVEVDVATSVATLFDPESDVAKSYKPLLLIAIDVRASGEGEQSEGEQSEGEQGEGEQGEYASICALLTCCEWVRDETLGTARWTQAELSKVGAPRFDRSWLLIDVIASRHRGCGVILALAMYLMTCRSRKYSGVVALAVTKSGRDLFAKLGFATHAHRSGGQTTTLCYARANSLSLQRVRRRLSFSGDQVLLDSLCWREGYTARSSDKVYPRCG